MATNKNSETEAEEKSKPLAINEVKAALLGWYEFRFNEISGLVEGRKVNEDTFNESLVLV